MRTTAPQRRGGAGSAVRRGLLPYRATNQRQRLIAAMGEMTVELGWPAVGVHHVCQRAGISRRTFYELYHDRDGCYVEAVQQAFDDLLAVTDAAAQAAGADWEDRAVAATGQLIAALDADRIMAALCVISPLAGNHAALGLRHDATQHIAHQLGDPPALPAMGAAVATGAVGAVFELLHRRLTKAPSASLADVAGPAIYLLLVPFSGRRRAAQLAADPALPAVTMSRPTSSDLHPGPKPITTDDATITELGRLTLEHLERHPGARNIDLCQAIDVRYESQMSRLLARLERGELITHRRDGRSNAWTLTPRGQAALHRLAVRAFTASTPAIS
jgi:AcrR family transcriptional regulator